MSDATRSRTDADKFRHLQELRKQYAYHEAGHLVMFYALGLDDAGGRADYVEIFSAEKAIANPKAFAISGRFAFSLIVVPREVSRLARAMFVLGGHVAELLLTKDENERYELEMMFDAFAWENKEALEWEHLQPEGEDIPEAIDLLKTSRKRRNSRKSYLKVIERVKATLTANLGLVETITEALVAKGTLLTVDIDAICRGKVIRSTVASFGAPPPQEHSNEFGRPAFKRVEREAREIRRRVASGTSETEPDFSFVEPCLRPHAREDWQNGDALGVVVTVGRGGCLDFVLGNIEPLLARGIYEGAFIHAYVTPKIGAGIQDRYSLELMLLVANPARLLVAGNPLPDGDSFTLYRGVADGADLDAVRRFSWTASPNVASWFAVRSAEQFGGKDPAVFSLQVERKHVWAFINDRQEQEFIVDVRWIRRARPRRLKDLPVPALPPERTPEEKMAGL